MNKYRVIRYKMYELCIINIYLLIIIISYYVIYTS